MISVVVPVLDEAANIASALDRLAREREPHEVVVVDGGSRDRTVALAEARGARVLRSDRGRGRQMNAGAAIASGDVLLFLHADTVLPPGALAAVRVAMSAAEVVGGGFRKRYDGGGPALRALEWTLNRWRSGARGHLVGTQAMFLRRQSFELLGGYREWPMLEDVELSDRLRRLGRIAVLPLSVEVSARRYRARGELRQIAVNALVLAAFRLGASPQRLHRLYRGARQP